MIQVIKTERQRRSILPVSFLISEMEISWQRNFRVFYLYRKNENRHNKKNVSAFNLALRHDVCVV